MKKNILSLLLLSTLCACFTSCMSKSITIIGKAENEKNIAVVITKDDSMYFIKGIHHWDSMYLNKMVKVRGILYIKKFINDSLHRVPGLYATRGVDENYILKPKWKLVK